MSSTTGLAADQKQDATASEETTASEQARGVPWWLSGIVPPVCTPLDDDLEVDVASLERLIAFHIDAGVSGLFVLGSSSEAAFLRDRQRDTVVEVTAKVAAGQVPVLAGAIDMTTGRVIDHALRAVERGADAVVATAPFYARATHPLELERHFRSIKAATGTDLVAYDIPVAVHTHLSPSLVAMLAADGVLQGVKDSSGDLSGFRQTVVSTRSAAGFSTFTGSELIVDAALLCGASGAVPGLANVDPVGYVELYHTCRRGDWAAAAAQQERLIRLFAVTTCGRPDRKGPSSSGLGGFKTSLMLRGIISSNAVAQPQIQLDDDEVASVKKILIEAGLL
jgi:4-hydroxy-tetrahydrodipicolinate synthase